MIGSLLRLLKDARRGSLGRVGLDSRELIPTGLPRRSVRRLEGLPHSIEARSVANWSPGNARGSRESVPPMPDFQQNLPGRYFGYSTLVLLRERFDQTRESRAASSEGLA